LHQQREIFHKIHFVHRILFANNMSSSDGNATTNENDQREAAALTARLVASTHHQRLSPHQEHASTPATRLPSVEISSGRHKYVLLYGVPPSHTSTERTTMSNSNSSNNDNHHDQEVGGQYIVASRSGAAYHRNVAEPMTTKMEQAQYSYIDVRGGGRLDLGTGC
jgi:hypothetical protein